MNIQRVKTWAREAQTHEIELQWRKLKENMRHINLTRETQGYSPQERQFLQDAIFVLSREKSQRLAAVCYEELAVKPEFVYAWDLA